jgi:predicted DNA-binding transcriptional regulator YafY
MRAARLLHMLLLLQNRGRMTTRALSETLEVSRRTILRDVDAMTEAGLPVLVFHGPGGGVASWASTTAPG